MTKLNKTKAVLTSLFFSAVMITKWIIAKPIYPFAYILKDWVYGDDLIKNYTIPNGVKKNLIKKFFWLFLDDDQPLGYSIEYATKLIGYIPVTRWDKFRCAYAWSAWRNPAYNINYNYFGNQSPIIEHYKQFGNYEWYRKLRSSRGDKGYQLVWFRTEDKQNRFIFSMAIQPFDTPITVYYGWNPDYNGRFTVAFKFK